MRDRASNSGLTLSNKSTLLANDKPLDKLIVGQLDAEGVSISLASAATHLRIDSYAGQEKMCDTPTDTMTGIQPIEVFGSQCKVLPLRRPSRFAII